MLQSIRDHTQGWIAGAIISLLILSFGFWGIHSYEGSGNTNVVAKVNGTEITKSQLAIAYERLRRQLQTQYSANYELPVRAEAELKNKALQTLINIQVLKQASFNSGYRINSQQIDSFLQSVPEFQVNGSFSITRFQQALESTLFNANDFLELIHTSLLIDQPRLGILLTSFALPNEVENTFALIGQQRDIQYLLIPQNHFSHQPINISADDVQTYYNQHQDKFKTPEQASIEFITLSESDIVKSIQPSDEMLQNFYNENSNSFAEPTHWEFSEITLPLAENAPPADVTKAQNAMTEIEQQAKDGKDFATLAQQFSATHDTLNEIPGELQNESAQLTKVGQISKPFRTNKGLVLLKVTKYKPVEVHSFEKVKDKVKDMLSHQQAEEKFSSMREKLANLTYEHPESLDAAAKSLGLKVQTTQLFTKEKGASDISSNTKVREAAFSNDVLNLQNNSDVIQLNPESAIVLRIKSHVPASLMPIEDVRNQIVAKLKEDAIEAKASALANEIKDKLESGTLKPEQVANNYHLNWTKVGYVNRYSSNIVPGVLQTAFDMAQPKELDKPVVYATTKLPNGYALVQLNNVKLGSLSHSKEQFQVYSEQIQSSQGVLEYALYSNSLMKKAKIVKEG